MALKRFFGKKKDKDAVEKPEETPVETTSETLLTETDGEPQVADVTFDVADVAESTAVAEESSEGEIPADTLVVSEEKAEADAEETPSVDDVEDVDLAEELPAEASSTEDTPADETHAEDAEKIEPAEEAVSIEPTAEPAESTQEDIAEAAEQSATPADVPAEAEAPAESIPVEELSAEYLADDGIVAMAAPAPEAETAPSGESETSSDGEASAAGEGEQAFVMDDEYLRAFMEEGAMDDFIYGGSTYEERQEALERIADNA